MIKKILERLILIRRIEISHYPITSNKTLSEQKLSVRNVVKYIYVRSKFIVFTEILVF